MVDKTILVVGLDLEPLADAVSEMPSVANEWEITFAASGRDAFKCLETKSFGAAVVDLALPDIHGAKVLDEIKKAHSDTLRFVYAPVSSDPSKLKAWGNEHHLLGKPCTARMLHDALKRAFNFALWVPGKAAHGLINNLHVVPSPPALYNDVVRELQSPSGSLDTVGKLIATDPGMTAKVLQLANSAAFGLHQTVTDASTAVLYLGVETVKSLILLTGTFSYFEGFKPQSVSLQAMWGHSLATAQCARLIAREERLRGEASATVYTAGLLHDLGKLVLATNLPEPFAHALRIAAENKIPSWKIERELLGACHADIGAALLGIWGVPLPIVEAVAWHHEPSRSKDEAFSPLTAVHVANVLAHARGKDEQGLPAPEVDQPYLERIGVAHRMADWQIACESA